MNIYEEIFVFCFSSVDNFYVKVGNCTVINNIIDQGEKMYYQISNSDSTYFFLEEGKSSIQFHIGV